MNKTDSLSSQQNLVEKQMIESFFFNLTVTQKNWMLIG